MAPMVCTRLWTKKICPPRSSSRRIACRTSFGEYGPTWVTIGRRSSGGVLMVEMSRTPLSAMYKRARDGGGGQGQHIHFGAHLLQRFLVGHAEALLFVDDHQPQVFELHIVTRAGGGCR